MSNRDTQFAGFAKLLLQEMLDEFADIYSERSIEIYEHDTKQMDKYALTIARRAYDLACHVATQTLTTARGDMGKIPDLTQWPLGERTVSSDSKGVENSATGGVVSPGKILIGGELMGGCDLEAYTDPADIISTFPGGAIVNAVLRLRKRQGNRVDFNGNTEINEELEETKE